MGATCGKEMAILVVRDELVTSNYFQDKLIKSTANQRFDELYETVEVIGEGSTCKVSKIKKRESTRSPSKRRRSSVGDEGQEEAALAEATPGKFFALKVINTDIVKPEFLDEMENEINLLQGLDHPRIIKAYETYRRGEGNRIEAIVMECCIADGDLSAAIGWPEDDVATIIDQILSAAAYLHDRNIVHRDLKFENILFVGTDESDDDNNDNKKGERKNLEIKVIDFGLAKKYLSPSDIHHERCGTLYTMSPEVMLGSYSGSSTDLWSIGIMTYILLSNGPQPFWGSDREQIKEAICTKEVPFDGSVWDNVSADAKDFISNLLTKNPEERLTAKEAMNHKFICDRRLLSNCWGPSHKISSDVQGSMTQYARYSSDAAGYWQ